MLLTISKMSNPSADGQMTNQLQMSKLKGSVIKYCCSTSFVL